MAEQIAAGWNNAAGLANWSSITPTGGESLLTPFLDSGYSPGQIIVKADGTVYESGYPTVELTFSYMLYDQIQHLKDTYCGGDYSGKVTIRTALERDKAEANYNAVMVLPTPPENSTAIDHVRDYVIRMTRIVAL